MKKILGATALAVALGSTALVAAPAQASTADASAGNIPLVEVLGADGVKFDKSWKDFDIVEAAAFAVLDANPDSPVGLLANGKVRLTAFVPTDKAFRILVKDLTGKKLDSEKKVFKAVASLGIDTVETVLLYHVVPGKTLTSDKVVAADGAAVPTALEDASVTVKVQGKKVFLVDNDTSDADPQVIVLDINRGNKQVAHGINRVLRPLDL
jgi:Fasciclin domain